MAELQREILEDDSEHYQLDEQTYDKRANTVKRWKQEQKLGKYNPEYNAKQEQLLKRNNELAGAIKIGDRCKLTNSDLPRLGTVRYVGLVPEIKENVQWVGVELDEPFGKNDGSIKGKYYFKCNPKYGSFVKPSVVEVGDFSPEDYDDDEI